MGGILSLRRFSDPDALRRIDLGILLRFFGGYREFFEKRGLSLPANAAIDGMDYDALSGILMSPDDSTPDDLAESLYYIHEAATPECMEALLELSRSSELQIDERQELTPEDVALQVWLQNREIVENLNIVKGLEKPRSFEYFQSETRTIKLVADHMKQVPALELALDAWFVENKQGPGSKIFVHPKRHEVWFSVRHLKYFFSYSLRQVKW